MTTWKVTAGNDYLEGNSGNDLMIGGQRQSLPSFDTDNPFVQQGYHLISASVDSYLTLDQFGNVVIPYLDIAPDLTQSLLPDLGLSATLPRDTSPVPTLGTLPRIDGVDLTALAAVTPTLSGHLDELADNDTLSGGSGADTMIGDNATQVSPLRTGNAALDLELDRLVRDVQQLGFSLRDLELERDYALRPTPQTYALGVDTMVGGSENDLMVGDNQLIEGPYRVETPASEGDLATMVAQLRAAITSYGSLVSGYRSGLAVNPSGYTPHTYVVGADTLYGDAGNDTIIGDDQTLLTPLLNTFTYTRSSFWSYGFGDQVSGRSQPLIDYALYRGNDTLNGGDGDDYLQGDYANTLVPLVTVVPQDSTQLAQLDQSLEQLVTDLEAYLRDRHNDTYGINFNLANQANLLVAGNDVMDGSTGNDLMLGDNATQVLPFIGGGLNLSLDIQNGYLDLRVDSHNFYHSLSMGFEYLYRQAGVGFTQLAQDTLYGNWGNDVLFGLRGADTLLGMDDNDYLFGGEGTDGLDGGPGSNIVRSGDPGRSDTAAILPTITARLWAFLSPDLMAILQETLATQATQSLSGQVRGPIVN
jgi:Ca2+-binding RTX toxin-like protein